MSGRYLLDTNIVIALFDSDPRVEARLEKVPDVFLPTTVLGELLYGTANSARATANALRIEEFAASCTPLPVDSDTARRYGTLRAKLRRRGRPIPENDLWIAACALQHDLILATRDGHFEAVDELLTEAW